MSLKNKKLKFNLQKFSEPITDLTGYTWVGDSSSLSGLDNITIYNLSFTSNNTSFITFKFELYSNRPVVFCLSYDSTNVFIADGTGWTNEAYQTIQITGGTDATDTSNKFASLLTWLQNNGTLIPPVQSEPISSFNSIKLNNNILSFNGIKYQLDGTASITDNNNSSFKGISIVDNDDDTATLFVDSNEIVVNYPSSEYEVIFTSIGWWNNQNNGRIKIYDGQDNTGTLLLDQNPANNSEFPMTLAINSGYCFVDIIGPGIMDVVPSGQLDFEFTVNYSGEGVGLLWGPINKDGTIPIKVADFDD